MHSRQALNLLRMRNAGSFRSAPGMASSRRTTASTEHDGAGGERAESFTSARSFGQTSLHSARSDALSTQACRSPWVEPFLVLAGFLEGLPGEGLHLL